MANLVKRKLARAGYSVKSIDANYMDYLDNNKQRTKGFLTPEDSKKAKKIASKIRKNEHREPSKEELRTALFFSKRKKLETNKNKPRFIKEFTNTL